MTAKKKVAKKVTKKVVAKKPTKAEIKLAAEVKKMEEENAKAEKEVKAHQANAEKFASAIEKLSKKHGIKAVMQCYDAKADIPFILAFNVENQFESKAMVALVKESFNL